jgi:hypothetical protein
MVTFIMGVVSAYSGKINTFAVGMIPSDVVVGRPVFTPDHRAKQMVHKRMGGDFPEGMSEPVKGLVERCW